MSLGLEEARSRLAYINQHRELTLAAACAITLAARVLGAPVPLAIVLLVGAWFALSVLFGQLSRRMRAEAPLRRLTSGFFLLKIVLLTVLAHYAGGVEWIAVMFFAVTILYANVVLPRRQGLWITAFAAFCFSALAGLEYFRWLPHHALFAPGTGYASGSFVLVTLAVGVAGGFGLLGLSSSHFARMLNSKAEALEAANLDLKATSQELRLHRDHLEERVRQRTGDLACAYEDLSQANRELRRLNEVKSNFLANVSHELRTPLTSIRSFSEILLTYPDEDIFTRGEFLEIIISESDRLTRLINDVLDLAKIEAGKMEWRLRPVQLDEVVRSSIDLMQTWAGQKGLRLLNTMDAGLPAVLADPDRLAQVFTNLLANALKFTREGSIQVGSLRRPDEVVVFVADTGSGIAPSDLDAIFEKFHQQGDSLTGKPAGTGLGLSICREILHHHGGRIWAESKPGCGATFFCSFPIPAQAALAATAGNAAAAGSL